MSNDYLQNGISLSPTVPSVGEKIKFVYDGILAKNGASEVFAHVGYGNTWDQSYDFRMTKTPRGFESVVPVERKDLLNVAFKDSAGHWDNNNGSNYTFSVK